MLASSLKMQIRFLGCEKYFKSLIVYSLIICLYIIVLWKLVLTVVFLMQIIKKIVSYIAYKSNLFNIGMIYDMKFVIYD